VAVCIAPGLCSVAEFQQKVGMYPSLAIKLEIALRMIRLCAKYAAQMAKVVAAEPSSKVARMANVAAKAFRQVELQNSLDENGSYVTLRCSRAETLATLEGALRRSLAGNVAVSEPPSYADCLRRLRVR
jgi:hypothetical protein